MNGLIEKWKAERERKAFLALADGTVFHGVAFGAATDGVGEVGALAAGTAVAYVGKKAFDSYATYEQLSGGIKKLFGDAASTVEANANKAYETAGMSANQYMETAISSSAAVMTGRASRQAMWTSLAPRRMAVRAQS